MQPGRSFLATLGLLLAALPAPAQITTTRGASLLFFPKIVADDARDTMIQIANTSPQIRHVLCFYVAGDPNAPDASFTVVDFDIWLTPRQPVHWVASRGRRVDPTDPVCDGNNLDCESAGIDPGHIPATPSGFQGYLSCVEADAAGFPVPGNVLVGKATLTEIESGDIATYSAVGFRSLDANNMNGVLCLGGGVSAKCPTGAEYDGCPAEWILQHPTVGSEDPLAGAGSEVDTSIVVIPCSQDLTIEVPTTTIAQFIVTNEFEELFSASTTVTLWADVLLSSISDVFDSTTIGGAVAQTRMRPAGLDDAGFVVIAQTHRNVADVTASTAVNVHADGTRPHADLIVIPLEP